MPAVNLSFTLLDEARRIEELFAAEPAEWTRLREEAIEAGLPPISVGPAPGRLLSMLAALAREGGARLAVEIGTLGGYSALCIARGMSPEGKLITIEAEEKHATFAREAFDRLGERRIEVREGKGLDLLPGLVAELGKGSTDLLFIDAIKTEYPGYYSAARPLVRSGGIVVADNVLGTGSFWIDAPQGSSDNRDAIDRFNRMVAADPDFESMIVPVRQGILVARRR